MSFQEMQGDPDAVNASQSICPMCGQYFFAHNDDGSCVQDTQDQPSIEDLMEWESMGGCEATDGCWVEPDGTCPHGKPSWLKALGMI